jgi:hypothetical protein
MLGVTATNPGPIVGVDALSDPALRQLNTNSLGVRGSNFGPRAAYAYAIQTAVNSVTGAPVNVNRWSISIASHTGQITIYVASPAGTVTTTDLQGISNNIEALARPDAVTVLPGLVGYPSAPGSATTVNYGPAITCYVYAPAVGTSATNFTSSPPSPATLQTAINNALTTWFEGPNNPIGGITAADDSSTGTGIFESGVTGIIGSAVAAFPNCFLLSAKYTGIGPPADLTLTAGQVAVWTGTVTVIVSS